MIDKNITAFLAFTLSYINDFFDIMFVSLLYFWFFPQFICSIFYHRYSSADEQMLCRSIQQMFCRHSADILQTFCRYSADILQIFCRHSTDILQTFYRYSADILQTFHRYSADNLQLICRLPADYLQICCRCFCRSARFLREMFQPYTCISTRVHLVPQLYINVNDLEGQRRLKILEQEDTN